MLYIKGEGGVGKSHMIYVLKMRFALLDKRNELIFLISIEYMAEDIRESIIYITLSINTCKAKSLSTNISRLYTYCLLFNINEPNMIYFRLLVLIDKQLYRAGVVIIFSTVLFDSLSLIVLINNFY